jgi:hypothetical protein
MLPERQRRYPLTASYLGHRNIQNTMGIQRGAKRLSLCVQLDFSHAKRSYFFAHSWGQK